MDYWRSFLSVFFTLLTLAAPATAQTFPTLTGRVVDDAQVLPTDVRATLTAQLAALEARNSDQVVVATVRSLEGRTTEDYANRLFRQWRLGQAAKNNGILVLIAPNERKVRIEVGYGLEGTLTDAVAKLIIENDMIPNLRGKRFDLAAIAGVADITQILTGRAAEWRERARAASTTRSHVHDVGVIEPPSVLGFVMMGVVFLVGLLMVGFVALLVVMLFVQLMIGLGIFPNAKARHGRWQWLNYVDAPKKGRWAASHPAFASSSSGSSGSSDSFSGGGGSSGGGGASGSW